MGSEILFKRQFSPTLTLHPLHSLKLPLPDSTPYRRAPLIINLTIKDNRQGLSMGGLLNSS